MSLTRDYEWGQMLNHLLSPPTRQGPAIDLAQQHIPLIRNPIGLTSSVLAPDRVESNTPNPNAPNPSVLNPNVSNLIPQVTCFKLPSSSIVPVYFEMTTNDIQYPSGFSLKDVVGWGTTGLVVLDESTRTVIKTPLDQENAAFILREQRIYERLTEKGGHRGLLKYYGTFEAAIRPGVRF